MKTWHRFQVFFFFYRVKSVSHIYPNPLYRLILQMKRAFEVEFITASHPREEWCWWILLVFSPYTLVFRSPGVGEDRSRQACAHTHTHTYWNAFNHSGGCYPACSWILLDSHTWQRNWIGIQRWPCTHSGFLHKLANSTHPKKKKDKFFLHVCDSG